MTAHHLVLVEFVQSLEYNDTYQEDVHFEACSRRSVSKTGECLEGARSSSSCIADVRLPAPYLPMSRLRKRPPREGPCSVALRSVRDAWGLSKPHYAQSGIIANSAKRARVVDDIAHCCRSASLLLVPSFPSRFQPFLWAQCAGSCSHPFPQGWLLASNASSETAEACCRSVIWNW